MKIHILCDGDWNQPEIEISGRLEDLVELGSLLSHMMNSASINTTSLTCDFYPINIGLLELELSEQKSTRLTVNASKNKLSFSGTTEAYDLLGQSLLNFFNENSTSGEHFHLEYFEGNLNINETLCTFIFMLE